MVVASCESLTLTALCVSFVMAGHPGAAQSAQAVGDSSVEALEAMLGDFLARCHAHGLLLTGTSLCLPTHDVDIFAVN